MSRKDRKAKKGRKASATPDELEDPTVLIEDSDEQPTVSGPGYAVRPREESLQSTEPMDFDPNLALTEDLPTVIGDLDSMTELEDDVPMILADLDGVDTEEVPMVLADLGATEELPGVMADFVATEESPLVLAEGMDMDMDHGPDDVPTVMAQLRPSAPMAATEDMGHLHELLSEGGMADTEDMPDDLVVLIDEQDEYTPTISRTESGLPSAEDVGLLRAHPSVASAATEPMSVEDLPELQDVEDITAYIDEADSRAMNAPNTLSAEYGLPVAPQEVDEVAERRAPAFGWRTAAALLLAVGLGFAFFMTGGEPDSQTTPVKVAVVDPVVGTSGGSLDPVAPGLTGDQLVFQQWMSDSLVASLGQPEKTGQ